MMNLHINKELFREIIEHVSNTKNLSANMIEKDYYVTMVLEEFHNIECDIVFKGGTSLSKGYHIINRFSEDIDINYLNHSKLNNKKRKEIKYNLKLAVENCGLSISNFETTRSKRQFNSYQIPYETCFKEIDTINSAIIVETAYQEKSYPCEKVVIKSIIAECLEEIGMMDIVEEYDLFGFEILVQSYKRTFIDKIFALGDYYLTNNIQKHSRHLYDLYKILERIKFDDDFFNLLNTVREERSKLDICPSSKENINIISLILEMLENDAYKNDYKRITLSLIQDDVSYETCKESLIFVFNKLKTM